MWKYLKYLPVIVVLLAFTYSNNQTIRNLIKWNEKTPLEWEDFKGIPPKGAVEAAITSYSILLDSAKVKNDSVVALVLCIMNRNNSWVKGEKNEYVLNHEQGHFNIAEIYARKLRQMILKYKFDKKNISKELNTLRNKMMDECDSYQDQYDMETNHSKNKDKQREWDRKIAMELKQMEAYKTERLKFTLR
ncbi:MAG: DUF922 domain-containing protein [Bacteroidetes bacterium]|nr:DUF922 domain-containing protein [Bacteroidota bacterium]